MTPSFINRPCTIVVRRESADVDAFNNPLPTEEAVETVCELQAKSFTEDGDQTSITRWQAFFLPEEQITGRDHIIVDNERYELIGDPWYARNPRTGEASHIEAELVKVGRGSEPLS